MVVVGVVVLCFFLFYEGFGLFLLEVLVMGMLVVGIDILMIWEVCGEFVWFALLWDAEVLVDVIFLVLVVLLDPVAGRAHVVEFIWVRMVGLTC